MTKEQVLEKVKAYIKENNMRMEINNCQELDAWIDGNRRFDEAVWVVNATNQDERAFEGSHLFSFVLRKSSGEIDDVSSI